MAFSQTTVSSGLYPASVGMPAYGVFDSSFAFGSLVNKTPQAKQSDSITITAAANSTAYTVTINGVDCTYTSDSSATLAEIADGLAAAINATPSVRAVLSASSNGVSVVTLTSLVSGLSYTLTESSANMTTAVVTANGSADAVSFGTLVVRSGFSGQTHLGGLAKASLFTAQVDSYALTYDAGKSLICKIVVNEQEYFASVTEATDASATAVAMAAAINAVSGLSGYVSAGSATSNVTLTAAIAGLEFSSSMYVVSPSVAIPVKTSNLGMSTSVFRSAVGVAVESKDEEVTSVGGTAVSYPANRGVKYLQRGEIWVTNSQGVANGDAVYVDLSSSGSGLFYNTSGTNRVRLPLSKAMWVRAHSASSLACLKINFF